MNKKSRHLWAAKIYGCFIAVLQRKKKFQQWLQQGYDRFICTPDRLACQPSRKIRTGERKISVAIPHWNRGGLIHRPLWNIIHDERVEEIVIVDDGSSEEEFALLVKNVAQYDRRKIVTIHRREENRGAQFTKIECVEKTTGAWMILLDSDNTLLPSYLNIVATLENLEEQKIYCPDWAFPYFCFHQLSGEQIDFQRACQLTKKGVLQRVYILNDGNYFFHRNSYLTHLLSLKDMHPDAADVMTTSYHWLSQGGFLEVLRGAPYIHRVDASSFWIRTSEKSRKRVMTIFDRLEKKIPWDDAFQNTLIK